MRVSDLLSGNARRSPHRPALFYRGRATSFLELARRANQVAHALEALGVKKGDRIGLFARNSPEWIEVFFGVSKMGAVLVPINFRLRGPEVAYLLEHSEPSVIILDEDLQAEVDPLRSSAVGGRLRYVVIGEPEMEGAITYAVWVSQAASLPPQLPSGSMDVHSVCYTSGTTGRPKGAVMTHRNVVVGAFYAALANIGFTRRDVFLNVAPFCHRAGWPRMVQAIGVGAPQVIVREFDPEGILSLMDRHRATTTTVVPTMVRLMERNVRASDCDVSCLRQIVVGGEACPLPVKQAIFELFPRVELTTVYASTEAGLVTLLDSEEQLERPDSAGLPFVGVELRVVDDQGAELPAGEVGEVAVHSGRRGEAGVMAGYLNDPEANQASFEGDWFRTGDAGFRDPEGYLYLTDRKSDMIVSGGLNIYSREVEVALIDHPGVAEAAVVGEPDELWGETVVAFVVRQPGRSVTEEELIAHCKERLASYKKPRAILFRDALPMSSIGKVLKYELRESLHRKGGLT